MSVKIDELVARVFDLDGGRVADDLTADDVDQWDSLNHLRLVTALEEFYGIKLKMREVMAMTSVSKIKEIVGQYVQNP